MPQTIRQQKVIKEITDNVRYKKYNNKGDLLKNCNYSDNISKQPSRVLNSKGVKEGLKPLIEQLEVERQRAIDNLKGKISDAKYRDLNDGIDKLTKNIQLLSGKPTDRQDNILNDDQIKTIIDRATKTSPSKSK